MLKSITTLIIIIGLVPNISAEPLAPSFTYQGKLQVNGLPANGEYDFKFELLDGPDGFVETDIPILIEDATVVDGVFSAELDLGESLFGSQQLWLDIAVRNGDSTDDYTRLSPAQKLTAAPYALHAEMVAMGAVSGFEVADNSLSASDLAPDSVGSSELTSGAVRASNINAAEIQLRVTGICPEGGAIQTVNQDGTVTCVANASGYTDANAVAAMLAADGAGSTLDADLLDGLHAGGIISAAIVGANNAVRTAITRVPITIDQAGSYYFTGNLSHSDTNTNAITITADNVTLDLTGFTLFGPGHTSGNANSGVEMIARAGVTVMNGTVRDFGNRGISALRLGSAHRVIDVRVVDNGGAGISLSGSNHQVRGCTAQGNGARGVFASSGSVLIGNTAAFNSLEGIVGGNGTTLTNNTARDNQHTGIFGGFGSTMTNNTAYLNADSGIEGDHGSTLINNSAYRNQGHGIFGGNGATLINNTASNNEGSGIVGFKGAALTNNTANDNGGWGIFGSSVNMIMGNAAASNNTSSSANLGGIRVGRDSRVEGNTVGGNNFNGIVIAGSDSIIDSNHVTDSELGFNFDGADNAYRNNTAAGNTTAFGGDGFADTTDLGGNASF